MLQYNESEIPSYTVIKKEGEGVFGIVIKGVNNKTGTTVAIKRVRKAELNVSREQEILIMVKDKPHCIQLQDSFISIDQQEKYVLNLVFEYVGSSLEKYIGCYRDNKKFIPMIEIKRISKQILEALKHIHGLKICHRDLKPDNILMNSPTDVKICDFGSAKVIQNAYDASNIPRIVARSYRPPELIFGHPAYDTSLDMWCIGCILFEMVALQILFDCKTDGDMFFEMCKKIGVPNKSEEEFLLKYADDDNKANVIKFVGLNSQMKRLSFYDIVLHQGPYSQDDAHDLDDLLYHLLQWDSSKRLTAEACVSHNFFKEIK